LGKIKKILTLIPNSLHEEEEFSWLDACKDFVQTGDEEPGVLNTIITENKPCFHYVPETKDKVQNGEHTAQQD
jgi:hypothetical protein